MKKILVTGGAGFIGSNFIKQVLRQNQAKVINLDALTYAGNLENLEEVETYTDYTFIKGNICDRELVERIFREHEITHVVNFAAESHVDRSIDDAEIFIKTNIAGTHNLLEVAGRHWNLEPGNKHCRQYRPNVKFLQVSTDEVYGSLGAEGYFTEESPILPNSPYSASKASADLMVRAYHETYGLPMNISRCSNNYGPNQFPEKLIPLMINNCLEDKELPIYGDGLQVRDWIHVNDHCEGLLTILEKGLPGEIYNLGGGNEKTNLELVRIILNRLQKPESLIVHLRNRPGGDFRYAIDNTKITRDLGWEPRHQFEQGILDTIDWYLNHTGWLQNMVSGEYQNYYRKMYGK